MEKCDVKTGTCEGGTETSGQCHQTQSHSQCACGGGCGGDPAVCAMLMWKCVFKESMRSVMVDIMKPKIQKKLGAKFDKAADVVLETMMVKFQSMVTVSKAKNDLEEKFRNLMSEG